MKKMRRMIPALCMLLVSAIMLSTASFAWFTMNDTVTASGMEVKATAAGALIISDQPLTYLGAGPSVSLKDASVHELTQVTLVKGQTTASWKEPATGAVIDQTTGVVESGSLADVTLPNFETFFGSDARTTSYFFDKEIYVATSGEALEKHSLELVLTAPSSAAGTATKAYAIAVYVMGVYDTVEAANDEEAYPLFTDLPTEIIYVDNSEDEETGTPRNTATINLEELGYAIPSIVGVGEQDTNVTGLKIVLRMFVDGDLASTEPTYVTKNVPLKSGSITNFVWNAENEEWVEGAIEFSDKYDPTKQYFIEETVGGQTVERPVVVPTDMEADDTILDDWYYYVDQTTEVNVKYVNDKNVPSNGSTLKLDITSAENVEEEEDLQG